VTTRKDESPRLETEGQTPNQDKTSTDSSPNFWDEVAKGKVRPAPREPDLTHYRNRDSEADS